MHYVKFFSFHEYLYVSGSTFIVEYFTAINLPTTYFIIGVSVLFTGIGSVDELAPGKCRFVFLPTYYDS